MGLLGIKKSSGEEMRLSQTVSAMVVVEVQVTIWLDLADCGAKPSRRVIDVLTALLDSLTVRSFHRPRANIAHSETS